MIGLLKYIDGIKILSTQETQLATNITEVLAKDNPTAQVDKSLFEKENNTILTAKKVALISELIKINNDSIKQLNLKLVKKDGKSAIDSKSLTQAKLKDVNFQKTVSKIKASLSNHMDSLDLMSRVYPQIQITEDDKEAMDKAKLIVAI